MQIVYVKAKKGMTMINKYNLNDIVKIEKGNEVYKIVGMHLNTYNNPKKVWYSLYRLSDGYICNIAENILTPVIAV